jgi:hypothetical protein
MEQFVSEALTGQSFLVVVLVAAVFALWQKTQESNKRLFEIIENNTRAQIEIKGVIERFTLTTEKAFAVMQEEIIEHHKDMLFKLQEIRDLCKK